MALGKIDHIHFVVEDLEKTVDYFTEKLGFKLVRHYGRSVELTLPSGDEIFEFRQMTEEDKTEDKPSGVKEPRPYLHHIAFQADDLDKTYEELKSKGLLFKTELDAPHQATASGRRLAHTYDGDGRRWIQIVQKE